LIILFIGDVVGKPGRRAVSRLLPGIKEKHSIDLTVANLENSAGGFGVTERSMHELERAGVDAFTSGNHIWDKREGVPLLDTRSNIVRPANYPPSASGSGMRVVRSARDVEVLLLNVQGRVFMPPLDCPFRTVDRLLGEADAEYPNCRIRLVDMHAEATSEKLAMGYHLDGRVSAVLGTHTHVRTGDAAIRPKGTAYVTDVGMTGAHDSVLGINKEIAIERFITMRPIRFEVAKDDWRIDAVILDIDEDSGRARSIEHTQFKVEE